jgi:hypothetical protein
VSSKSTGASSGTVPRITLRCPAEAATALGISDETFNTYVRPELRTIKLGRWEYVSIKELEKWADSHAARVLRGERS